ncbi:hypothetical protein G6N05_15255 [Flavobacterium sp. F372]|uniref:WG repeat-containing protein n=1 Tax=Flavobacterium bernardetii TaxID=2813823 RepID=A0ABR7J2D2_9FLAO|nr:WG repeat-containing protein [Flavobacterium bernardetii]MBC5836245.1 WG repeat-containing protein [Flavobacterium bernardetii]NHF71470.1 hypothetical protein [Flavobacterium bernardetii]
MRTLYNIIILFVITSSFSQNKVYEKLQKRLPYLIQFNEAFDNLDNYPECTEIDCQYKKVSINYIFEEAYPFIKNFALVKFNGKYGIIDKKGVFLVEPIYETIKFHDGDVKFDEKLCFSFRYGKIVNSCDFICGYPKTYIGIQFVENNKYQIIDKINKIKSQVYDSIASNGKYYLVKKNEKWGVIKYDSIFKQVINLKYKNAKFINYGIALLNSDNLWEYYKVDIKPKLILTTKILCEPYVCVDDKLVGVFKTKNGKYNLLYNDKSIFEEFDSIDYTGIYAMRDNKVYIIKNKLKQLLYILN